MRDDSAESQTWKVPEENRRLAAIMFTDIVGYTALAQKNESLALELLEHHRSKIRPIFSRHKGKEIKTIGDAFLVEFPSALEGVRCAFDIQESVHETNLSRERENQVFLRIGIHVGDVVQSGADIYGDAVNVASRIEPLARPGGICLTQQVYDHVRNKFQFPIISHGKHELKNVQTPVEIYSVELPWEMEKSSGEKSPTLDRHRLAVLPLVSLTSDPEDEFFSDGLTEELISTVSLVQELKVISRTSVMRYKKTQKGISEIGRELNAGSVLEGSMRRYGKKIRVTAQLIDVQKDEHLWAQNYDRDLEDVFAIQSDIARNIAESLKVQLLADEKQRIESKPTSDVEAHKLYLKGRYYWNERTEEGLKKAIDYFKKAIEKDPGYALAYVGIADCYQVLGDYGFLPLKKVLPEATKFATKALDLDSSIAEAHASLGAALGEEKEFRRAFELNPNYSTAHQWYSLFLLGKRRKEEALSEAKKAVELDPLSMQIKTFLGIMHYENQQYDEAIKELMSCIEFEPNFVNAHYWIAIVYVEKSMFDEAIREMKQANDLMKSSRSMSGLGYVYARAGRKEEAMKMLEELKEKSKKNYVSYFDFALICTGLGLYDEALEWLGRSFSERSELLDYQLTQNCFAPLRSDEKFQTLLKKVSG